MNEQTLSMGPTNSCVGIFTPAKQRRQNNAGSKVAVLLLNSGLIHHAGPGRVYTRLARALSDHGLSTVRFDLSGIGDSAARQDNLSIYQIATQEPIEVMDYLQKRGYHQFILAGICSGAYCSFKTAIKDQRVIATALINYQDDTSNNELASQAWSKRYWTDSLFRLGAWKNLLTGKVDYQRLFSTLGLAAKKSTSERTVESMEPSHSPLQNASFTDEMDVLLERNCNVLLLVSGLDISQQFLNVLLGEKLKTYQKNPLIDFKVVDGADHLFTNVAHQNQFMAYFCEWAAEVAETQK